MLRRVPRPIVSPLREAFDHVPAPIVQRARVVVVPTLTPGVGGMTLGRLILMRRDRRDDLTLLAHELVHVQQWTEFGVFGFLIRYLGSYVVNLSRTRRHRLGYLAIPFERDARREASRWRASHPELVV